MHVQLGQQTNVIAGNTMEFEGNGSTSTNKIPALSDITSIFTLMLADEKEKDKRKLNLVVHKVPEPTSSNTQERKTHDFKHVHTILQKHLGLVTTSEKPI